jgi:threonine dehydrogenase-like Zn-dependent dehydrogenase
MRASVFHGKGDIRIEEVADPGIVDPTDALVRITHAAICGSDLWFYRGVWDWKPGYRTGHEFTGIVEAVGDEVRTLRPGDRVIAPFVFSDGTCEFCRRGLQTSCVRGTAWGALRADGGQGEAARVPFADGTLVRIPEAVAEDPGRLAAAVLLSDVLPTGYHAAVCAEVGSGDTVAVIGDGAVGLCAVLSAAYRGAARVIAVGHHADRLDIARRLGATDVVDSGDPDVAARLVDMTGGGPQCVLEAVGAQGPLDLAAAVARPGGRIGYVGVPAGGATLGVSRIFGHNITVRGGVAPARHYLPELLPDVATGRLDASEVLTMRVPLDGVPDGYRAMDGRTAVKVLVEVAA